MCVVLLDVSAVDGGPLTIPRHYDGNWDFWQAPGGTVRNYAFAFHAAYHQPNAFVVQNPGLQDIDREPDVASQQRWYDIEIGCRDGQAWMKINGLEVLEGAVLGDPLPASRIGLRLRGPGDGTFSCLYRNLRIEQP